MGFLFSVVLCVGGGERERLDFVLVAHNFGE